MTTAFFIVAIFLGLLALWIAASRFGYLRGFDDGVRCALEQEDPDV